MTLMTSQTTGQGDTKIAILVADAEFSSTSVSIGKKLARRVFAAHGEPQNLAVDEPKLAAAFAAAAEAMLLVLS